MPTMILTLTPNPSIDVTLSLDETLTRGAVHRAAQVTQVAGGKGVNVSHAAFLAGEETTALFPAAESDSFLTLISEAQIPAQAVRIADKVRINTTVTEPDGTTTKINDPGPALSQAEQRSLISSLEGLAAKAEWIVMAGSLPQGVPVDWYSQLTAALRTAAPNARIAVDTSDAPMQALGANLDAAAPHLIKPNGLELGQLTDTDGLALEKAAEEGDFSGVVEAARVVVKRGIDEVLVTLGGAGAVLVTAQGAWKATPPPVTVRSTVGAGDSSLAGYILARKAGKDFTAALAQSVAYGTAAAGLPGTQIPAPETLNIEGTTVSLLS